MTKLKMGRVRDGQINTKNKFLLDQNHKKLNKISDPCKVNLGLFFGDFRNFSRDEIGDGGGQIRGNQELLIPYDVT